MNAISSTTTKVNYLDLFKKPKQLYFDCRMLVATEPKFWMYYQLWIIRGQLKSLLRGINPRERVVSNDTQLVLDGFQGSANSFGTAAFQNSQTKPVKIAHHMHSPAQIIQAIEKNIPVLLFIREPKGAVISLASRWSYISVNSGLKSYINFYTKLEFYQSHYVVSTFDQTTNCFDTVIEKLNRKFDTNFDLIKMAQVTEKFLPSQEKRKQRKQIKQQKKQEFSYSENIKLLEEAQKIYQRYEAIA